jgi:phosphoribosylaminoimidazole (AIR) synthetase
MEMYHVFNMGIGMVVIVSEDEVDAALEALKEEAVAIGEAVAWDGQDSRVSL